jgi:hypothetical protein
MLENLQYLSILFELVIAIFGILIATQKKKKYGWAIFVTFIIYVLYDFSKMTPLNIHGDILYLMFFVATLSALYFTWMIYRRK